MKSKINYKTLTIATIVCVGLIAAGSFLGSLMGKRYFVPTVDYSHIVASDVEDDNSKAIQKYQKYQEADKPISDYVKDFTLPELAAIGFYQSGLQKYSVTESEGLVTATLGIKQDIRSYHIKDDQSYFFESLSKSSIVKVAKRFYQNTEDVEWYSGSLKSLESAQWDATSKSSKAVDEFEELWGKELSRQSVYIISDKTVLDTSSVTTTEEGLNISFDLDPVYSVVRYVKQMVQMSELEADPIFSKVHYEMTLDTNFNMVSTHSEETYRVKKMGWNNADGWLNETISYGQETAIPNLETNCSY